MNTRIYRISEYHRMILRCVVNETSHDLFGDLKSIVGDFVIATVTGIAYAAWSYIKQNTTIDWVGVILSVFCGFLVWAFLLFLKNSWKIPAIQYRKKESQATLPSWEDIETRVFEFPPTSGFGIGVEIISHKPEREFDGSIRDPYIYNVMPMLSRVSKDGQSESFPHDLSSALSIVQGINTFEGASHIQSKKDLARDRRKFNVLSIANWDKETAWITIGKINDQKKIDLNEGKTYSIDIEIRDARVTPPEVTMNTLIIHCDLLFKTDNNGEKQVSLQIMNRSDEFDNHKC